MRRGRDDGADRAETCCVAVGALVLAVGAQRLGEAAALLPVSSLLFAAALIPVRHRRLGSDQARKPCRRRRRRRALAVSGLILLLMWCAALVGMERSVRQDRQYWAQPRGDPAGLLYVALGDSAAQGIGASRPDLGYVGLLAGQLRTATGRGVRVLNLSRSGARIEDVLHRQLPRLHGLHPDLVTVAIGGNDVRAYDAPTFARRVDELTAALPSGALVADVPYFMHGHWERDATQAAATTRVSTAGRGLTVVRLHAALQRQGWPGMLTQTAADWFHPNDRGYRIWARAFWEAFRTSSTCLGTAAYQPPPAGRSCPALAQPA